MDEYEILCVREYDDEKQRMTAEEAKALAKEMDAEIIDANHFCNPNVKIENKYMPCFFKDSKGSLWRGDGDYFCYGGGRGILVGGGLDVRGGVVLMRKKKED